MEAQVITEASQDCPDLLQARRRAKEPSLAELQARAAELAMQLEAGSRRERQVFDALELSVTFALPGLTNFEPVVSWHFESVSEKQADRLRGFGVDPASVRNRGHGSLILRHLHARRVAGLVTYRQLRYLIRFGYKKPLEASFSDASAFLDRHFGRYRKSRFHPPKTAACI